MVSGLERVLGIYFWFEREGIVDRRDGWMDGWMDGERAVKALP
jgi:hypothetical protein